MEVLKGVHVVECYAVSAILTDDRMLLVDTSMEESARTILTYMKKAGLRATDITTIFITHTHPDHVGGLSRLVKETDATVAAHEVEAKFISREETYTGPPGVQKHPGTPVDVKLRDGQVYEGLRVIYTPGHTLGSMSLMDEEHSLLIAGDAVRNEDGIGPMDDQYNVNPSQHRESIRKLAQLDYENLIVGHGTAVIGGAGAKVRSLAATL